MALVAALVGCSGPHLFPSRVDVAPLERKLAESGGSLLRILHPHSAADLDALEAGKRYKFVVLGDGALAVAPLPADAPGNEYVHPILGGGAAVRTAGGLRIERVDGRVTAVVVDENSKSYCPSFASLVEAERALDRIGVPRAIVRREDRAPACVGAPPR